MAMDLSSFVVGVVAFVVTALYLRTRRPANFPPGPWGWPFIGHLHLINNQFHKTADNLLHKYGPVTGLQLGIYPGIILSDYNVIKHALYDLADDFSNRPIWMHWLKRVGGNHGIGFNNGPQWKTNRKLALMSMREVGFGDSSLEEKIMDEVKVVLSEMEKVKTAEEFKFGDIFSKATANVTCSFVWGQRYSYDDAELVDLVEKLEFLFQKAGVQNVFQFLPKFCKILAPILKPEIVKFGRDDRDMKRVMLEKVQQHRETFHPETTRDMIDLFIAANQLDEEVVATVMDIFKGGFETSSTTLLWAFLFLIKHPEIQEECRQEIQRVIGVSRLPCMKDREQMPFMHATIHVIQRLGNVLAFTLVHGTTDRPVQLCGYTIPAQTVVFINLYSLHMNAEHWGDPEQFRPQRFLSPDRKHVIKQDHFMPFGYGRRVCLGENLAKMEIFLTLTSLLQRFKFTAPDRSDLPDIRDASLGVTLIPKEYGLRLEPV